MANAKNKSVSNGFSRVIIKRGESEATIEMFDYIRKYQSELISYMLYKPDNNKAKYDYRNGKIFKEVRACELWMKKHVWKLAY